MNHVVLIGRTTKDIEVMKTNSGKSVSSFTLAVDRYNGNGENLTDFINCVAWNKTAETLSRYVHKGHKVGIEGSLQVRSYEDKQGQNRYVTEVVVNRIEFLQSRSNEQSNDNSNEIEEINSVNNAIDIDTEDLPF